jgi:hypothetical protein
MPTDAQQACFEAGIKFGSLYHQFAGTPVSPASAASLARAMEEAIENQPFCESVTVRILEDELAAAMDDDGSDGEEGSGGGGGEEHGAGEDATGGAGYAELTGRFMEVEMQIRYGSVTVETAMEMEDGYPLMRLSSVEEPLTDVGE